MTTRTNAKAQQLELEDWYQRFRCVDCRINTAKIGEYYVVEDKIWAAANIDGGMLCIGCLELRLGQQLTRQDFKDCPLNINPQGSCAG
jgi:hypothetical protein